MSLESRFMRGLEKRYSVLVAAALGRGESAEAAHLAAFAAVKALGLAALAELRHGGHGLTGENREVNRRGRARSCSGIPPSGVSAPGPLQS